MMVVLFSVPLSMLCFYLAYLCYRHDLYQHTLVLTVIAVFTLVLSVTLIGAGYVMNEMITTEIAAGYKSLRWLSNIQEVT
ncbi:MAG: hypothetical protein JRF07_00160 [Deltaproteobacteria bacterium]|jgi:hypothetical protein|nr:hypothetical protein [Deltaproteobacteria bacterium]